MTPFTEPYRDTATVTALLEAIRTRVTRSWKIMEVCGGQTHAILRVGLDQLLPAGIELLHGPGCPVCVTDPAIIDDACALAIDSGVILCSFGDMLRVPGHEMSLQVARSRGADVRVVYSPLDALVLARQHPEREVVFLAVGFETTVPAYALAVKQARAHGITNFSLLTALVTVPAALAGLLSAPGAGIDAFLAAGHVCTVMGFRQYHAISERWQVPIAVTGFEPVDLLRGVLACVTRLEAGEARVDNCYERCVSERGNVHAQALVAEVFEPVDRDWRGLGVIPASGLGCRDSWMAFDARARFRLGARVACGAAQVCQAADVMQGRMKPSACPAFGRSCTPDTPLGATMVSGEGACNAYYQYRFDPAEV